MKIGNFNLETDGTFIIAELSANHNGSLKNALDTIKKAKEIGANAIKIQTYTADTITLNSRKEDFMISGGTLWDGKNLYDLYQEAYTPWEWHEELFNYARSIGIDIFSSPFDKTAVDLLEKFSPSAYKIASFEITDIDLIEYVALKGRPVIISTGIATLTDIELAVETVRKTGNNDIILLKCTSSYPAPLEEINLNTIPNLKETFGVTVGLSDHTLGISVPVGAVALGAKIVEKHFIADRKIGGPDSAFSLDPKQFKNMIDSVREIEKALGKVSYKLTPKIEKSRGFSRSLYVAKDIKEGEIFTEENLRSVRPGYGLHPKYLKDFLGKKATRNYEFGERFQ
ncbi:pseudaminic acid synthase [Thiovulum sp. ES]|nr:pseudaminic acid synthase [Thiovulum sp. ES]